MGLVQGERVAGLPFQFAERRSAPESSPQTVGQGADVGSCGAGHSERNAGEMHGQDLHPENCHISDFNRHLPPGTMQGVKRTSLMFGRGNGGDFLPRLILPAQYGGPDIVCAQMFPRREKIICLKRL